MKHVGGSYYCDCGTRDIDETCIAGLDCRAIREEKLDREPCKGCNDYMGPCNGEWSCPGAY